MVTLQGKHKGDVMTDWEDKEDVTSSAIQQFFEGTSVFITGGTGFMGQVLLEKLLRSCPGIERVYLLIRPKKGKEVQQRLEEIFQGDLFSVLIAAQPSCHTKVTLVSGDVGLADLGLALADRAVLSSQVHVVFHAAATVRFDEKLRLAKDINVRGTQLVLALAREMTNLKALVHVSTAYANCPIKEIGEEFYKPGLDDVTLEELCESLDDEQLEIRLKSVLGEWPNTYAFTKAIAEDCVRKYGQDLPVAIVRPSIVINTALEPIKGWINNVYGAIGVTAGAGVGLLRTLHCDKDIVADIVPVDLAINCCIAAAANVETKRLNQTSSTNIPIYNYVSSADQPITWGEYMEYAEVALPFPPLCALWYYCFTLNSNKYVHTFYVVFFHLLPALLVDTAARIVGKKPMLWQAYKKIHKFSDVIEYFTTQQWRFHTHNVRRLWHALEPRDQQLFNFNMAALDWRAMMMNALVGVRSYIFNETLDNLAEARARHFKLKIAHYTIVTLLKLLPLLFLYWLVRLYI